VADDRDGRVSAILAYHEATKHSPESVRRRFHRLDWDNKPHPFKVYPGLDRVDLPDDVPSLDVPALETIAAVAAPRPAPGPDLASLARLLLYGAGVHHTVTFPSVDVTRFRNYASAGALYPVEVYVACADLAGLPGGVYHFDPAGRALTRLREGDHRASWSARPPPSRPWPGPRPCSPSPASPGGPRGSTRSAGTATCSGTPA